MWTTLRFHDISHPPQLVALTNLPLPQPSPCLRQPRLDPLSHLARIVAGQMVTRFHMDQATAPSAIGGGAPDAHDKGFPLPRGVVIIA